MKLSIKAFSLSCGIVWGVTVLLSTFWILIIGAAGKTLGMLAKFYIGYSVSWGGAFIGLIWGFVDGLIVGAIFALLYNKLSGAKE